MQMSCDRALGAGFSPPSKSYSLVSYISRRSGPQGRNLNNACNNTSTIDGGLKPSFINVCSSLNPNGEVLKSNSSICSSAKAVSGTLQTCNNVYNNANTNGGAPQTCTNGKQQACQHHLNRPATGVTFATYASWRSYLDNRGTGRLPTRLSKLCRPGLGVDTCQLDHSNNKLFKSDASGRYAHLQSNLCAKPSTYVGASESRDSVTSAASYVSEKGLTTSASMGTGQTTRAMLGSGVGGVDCGCIDARVRSYLQGRAGGYNTRSLTNSKNCSNRNSNNNNKSSIGIATRAVCVDKNKSFTPNDDASIFKLWETYCRRIGRIVKNKNSSNNTYKYRSNIKDKNSMISIDIKSTLDRKMYHKYVDKIASIECNRVKTYGYTKNKNTVAKVHDNILRGKESGVIFWHTNCKKSSQRKLQIQFNNSNNSSRLCFSLIFHNSNNNSSSINNSDNSISNISTSNSSSSKNSNNNSSNISNNNNNSSSTNSKNNCSCSSTTNSNNNGSSTTTTNNNSSSTTNSSNNNNNSSSTTNSNNNSSSTTTSNNNSSSSTTSSSDSASVLSQTRSKSDLTTTRSGSQPKNGSVYTSEATEGSYTSVLSSDQDTCPQTSSFPSGSAASERDSSAIRTSSLMYPSTSLGDTISPVGQLPHTDPPSSTLNSQTDTSNSNCQDKLQTVQKKPNLSFLTRTGKLDKEKTKTMVAPTRRALSESRAPQSISEKGSGEGRGSPGAPIHRRAAATGKKHPEKVEALPRPLTDTRQNCTATAGAVAKAGPSTTGNQTPKDTSASILGRQTPRIPVFTKAANIVVTLGDMATSSQTDTKVPEILAAKISNSMVSKHIHTCKPVNGKVSSFAVKERRKTAQTKSEITSSVLGKVENVDTPVKFSTLCSSSADRCISGARVLKSPISLDKERATSPKPSLRLPSTLNSKTSSAPHCCRFRKPQPLRRKLAFPEKGNLQQRCSNDSPTNVHTKGQKQKVSHTNTKISPSSSLSKSPSPLQVTKGASACNTIQCNRGLKNSSKVVLQQGTKKKQVTASTGQLQEKDKLTSQSRRQRRRDNSTKKGGGPGIFKGQKDTKSKQSFDKNHGQPATRTDGPNRRQSKSTVGSRGAVTRPTHVAYGVHSAVAENCSQRQPCETSKNGKATAPVESATALPPKTNGPDQLQNENSEKIENVSGRAVQCCLSTASLPGSSTQLGDNTERWVLEHLPLLEATRKNKAERPESNRCGLPLGPQKHAMRFVCSLKTKRSRSFTKRLCSSRSSLKSAVSSVLSDMSVLAGSRYSNKTIFHDAGRNKQQEQQRPNSQKPGRHVAGKHQHRKPGVVQPLLKTSSHDDTEAIGLPTVEVVYSAPKSFKSVAKALASPGPATLVKKATLACLQQPNSAHAAGRWRERSGSSSRECDTDHTTRGNPGVARSKITTALGTDKDRDNGIDVKTRARSQSPNAEIIRKSGRVNRYPSAASGLCEWVSPGLLDKSVTHNKEQCEALPNTEHQHRRARHGSRSFSKPRCSSNQPRAASGRLLKNSKWVFDKTQSFDVKNEKARSPSIQQKALKCKQDSQAQSEDQAKHESPDTIVTIPGRFKAPCYAAAVLDSSWPPARPMPHDKKEEGLIPDHRKSEQSCLTSRSKTFDISELGFDFKSKRDFEDPIPKPRSESVSGALSIPDLTDERALENTRQRCSIIRKYIQDKYSCLRNSSLPRRCRTPTLDYKKKFNKFMDSYCLIDAAQPVCKGSKFSDSEECMVEVETSAEESVLMIKRKAGSSSHNPLIENATTEAANGGDIGRDGKGIKKKRGREDMCCQVIKENNDSYNEVTSNPSRSSSPLQQARQVKKNSSKVKKKPETSRAPPVLSMSLYDSLITELKTHYLLQRLEDRWTGDPPGDDQSSDGDWDEVNHHPNRLSKINDETLTDESWPVDAGVEGSYTDTSRSPRMCKVAELTTFQIVTIEKTIPIVELHEPMDIKEIPACTASEDVKVSQSSCQVDVAPRKSTEILAHLLGEAKQADRIEDKNRCVTTPHRETLVSNGPLIQAVDNTAATLKMCLYAEENKSVLPTEIPVEKATPGAQENLLNVFSGGKDHALPFAKGTATKCLNPKTFQPVEPTSSLPAFEKVEGENSIIDPSNAAPGTFIQQKNVKYCEEAPSADVYNSLQPERHCSDVIDLSAITVNLEFVSQERPRVQKDPMRFGNTSTEIPQTGTLGKGLDTAAQPTPPQSTGKSHICLTKGDISKSNEALLEKPPYPLEIGEGHCDSANGGTRGGADCRECTETIIDQNVEQPSPRSRIIEESPEKLSSLPNQECNVDESTNKVIQGGICISNREYRTLPSNDPVQMYEPCRISEPMQDTPTSVDGNSDKGPMSNTSCSGISEGKKHNLSVEKSEENKKTYDFIVPSDQILPLDVPRGQHTTGVTKDASAANTSSLPSSNKKSKNHKADDFLCPADQTMRPQSPRGQDKTGGDIEASESSKLSLHKSTTGTEGSKARETLPTDSSRDPNASCTVTEISQAKNISLHSSNNIPRKDEKHTLPSLAGTSESNMPSPIALAGMSEKNAMPVLVTSCLADQTMPKEPPRQATCPNVKLSAVNKPVSHSLTKKTEVNATNTISDPADSIKDHQRTGSHTQTLANDNNQPASSFPQETVRKTDRSQVPKIFIDLCVNSARDIKPEVNVRMSEISDVSDCCLVNASAVNEIRTDTAELQKNSCVEQCCNSTPINLSIKGRESRDIENVFIKGWNSEGELNSRIKARDFKGKQNLSLNGWESEGKQNVSTLGQNSEDKRKCSSTGKQEEKQNLLLSKAEQLLVPERNVPIRGHGSEDKLAQAETEGATDEGNNPQVDKRFPSQENLLTVPDLAQGPVVPSSSKSDRDQASTYGTVNSYDQIGISSASPGVVESLDCTPGLPTHEQSCETSLYPTSRKNAFGQTASTPLRHHFAYVPAECLHKFFTTLSHGNTFGQSTIARPSPAHLISTSLNHTTTVPRCSGPQQPDTDSLPLDLSMNGAKVSSPAVDIATLDIPDRIQEMNVSLEPSCEIKQEKLHRRSQNDQDRQDNQGCKQEQEQVTVKCEASLNQEQGTSAPDTFNNILTSVENQSFVTSNEVNRMRSNESNHLEFLSKDWDHLLSEWALSCQQRADRDSRDIAVENRTSPPAPPDPVTPTHASPTLARKVAHGYKTDPPNFERPHDQCMKNAAICRTVPLATRIAAKRRQAPPTPEHIACKLAKLSKDVAMIAKMRSEDAAVIVKSGVATGDNYERGISKNDDHESKAHSRRTIQPRLTPRSPKQADTVEDGHRETRVARDNELSLNECAPEMSESNITLLSPTVTGSYNIQAGGSASRLPSWSAVSGVSQTSIDSEASFHSCCSAQSSRRT